MDSLNDELCKNWDEKGKELVVELFKTEDFDMLCYKLVNLVINEKITKNQFVSVLPTPLTDPQKISLVDIFWMIDFDCKNRSQFIQMLLHIINQEIISEQIFRERLEIQTCEELGIVNSKEKVISNQKKQITNQFYRQKKFNLLSEETEGYSKLLLEIHKNSLVFSPENNEVFLSGVASIKEVIGLFSLDPNRCLDLILESWILSKDSEEFHLKLIKELYSSVDFLSDLINLKFFWYYKNDKLKYTPKNLFLVTVKLIKNNLISFEKIFSNLKPSDGEFYKELLKCNFENRKNFNYKNPEINLIYSQKIQLLSEFLKIKDLDYSMKLLNFMHHLKPCSYKEVYVPLLEIFKEFIIPIYENFTLQKELGEEQPEKVEEKNIYTKEIIYQLQNYIFPLIIYLGPRLGRDVVSFTKAVRIITDYFIKTKDFTNAKLIFVSLLSGLTSAKVNIGLTTEIWNILERFSYQNRFLIYELLLEEKENNIILNFEFQVVSKKTSDILKKVSKDNIRQKARAIAKLFSYNPLATCKLIIQYLVYEVFVTTISEMLKYSNPLIRDILMFQIIRRLEARGKNTVGKFGEDKYSESTVLQHYSNFLSILCKKFFDLDLRPIFDHIERHIRITSWPDLYLLRQIIKTVSGEEIYDQIKENQIESLAGGHILRLENGFDSSYLRRRNRLSSINSLLNWIIRDDCKISLNLVVLLGKLRKSSLFIKSNNQFFKKITYAVDKIQETLLILLQFLKYYTTIIWKNGNMEKKQKNYFVVPQISKLYELGIQPEIIFAITRPTFNVNSIEESMKKFQDYDTIKKFFIKGERFIKVEISDDFLSVFTLFWVLDIYLIYTPKDSYRLTIEQCKKEFEMDQSKIFKNSKLDEKERKDQIKKKKEASDKVIKFLEKEQTEQIQSTEKVINYLISNLKTIKTNITILHFIQYCVYPRCSISTTDSLYCAYFLEILNDIDRPIFDMYNYLNHLFQLISSWLVMSTEGECIRISRFLSYQLKFIHRRLRSRKIYKGSVKNYPDFKSFHYRIHGDLTKKIVRSFYTNNIEIKKNVVLALNEMKTEYPVYRIHAKNVYGEVKRIENYLIKNNVKDNLALFTSYVGFLKGKINSKSLYDIDEEDYYREKLLKEKELKKTIKKNPVKKSDATVTVSSTSRKRKERENDESKKKKKEVKRRKIVRPKIEKKDEKKQVEKKIEKKTKTETKAKEKVETKTKTETKTKAKKKVEKKIKTETKVKKKVPEKQPKKKIIKKKGPGKKSVKTLKKKEEKEKKLNEKEDKKKIKNNKKDKDKKK